MNFDHPIELATISGTFTGDAAAVYPSLKKVAERVWDFPLWITSIEFSTSLTVYPTDTAGMIVTMGKVNEPLSVGGGLSSVIAHITAPNSIAGPPAFALPSSKVSTIPFGGCGFLLESQTPISIYAFSNVTVAGNFLFAIASVQYRRAKKN